MVVGTLSLVQKGQTRGCSGCRMQWNSGIWWWGHCPLCHCIHWFDIFAPKTMSPPPYITIPLCPLHTVYYILWFDLFAPKNNVPTTIYHYSTVYCIHYVHWFDLFAPKTMSPPQYITIPLCPLHTASSASSGLIFLHQRQCPHHHIPLSHCVLCPLRTASSASTGLTFLHQRQCPHHHIPLFNCKLHHCILRPLHPVV